MLVVCVNFNDIKVCWHYERIFSVTLIFDSQLVLHLFFFLTHLQFHFLYAWTKKMEKKTLIFVKLFNFPVIFGIFCSFHLIGQYFHPSKKIQKIICTRWCKWLYNLSTASLLDFGIYFFFRYISDEFTKYQHWTEVSSGKMSYMDRKK